MEILNLTTPSNRHRTLVHIDNIEEENSVKSLTIGINKINGRNNQGRITVYQRGGGHKRKYRKIDFKRNILNIKAKVINIEYDPNRTANIALIGYRNGILSYIIASKDMIKNLEIESSIQAPIKVGNTLILKNILVGTVIHNVELVPGKGGQLIRAAGTYGVLIHKRKDGNALIRLSSGEIRLVSLYCRATIGIVSNIENNLVNYGKAGRSRWLGRRPVVRGVAMNPVDHPHGGRTKGGMPSVTPWGLPTKGYRTVKKKNKYIVSRRFE